ncbi:MAG: xanthine dehydrogenase family protein molybdopterin-binding subunit, partial [Deltaproteobacteria bacterium]|nr:xanthine dehydrogenase family protein molybdopterin-binding subunit [Deltaproteobacteria bacterium]
LPGVKAIITYENSPDWITGKPPHSRVLDRKVRFVGDAVAVVAATKSKIAQEAIERIEVEYERLPAVFDVDEALKPDAPQLYDQFPGNTIPVDVPTFHKTTLSELVLGDVEKGFREADFICEGECFYEGLPNPLPIEPPGLIVHWDGPRKLTVWSATQSPYQFRFVMQPEMGFPDIRSIGMHCGGSYGSKNRYAHPFFYAAALAKITNRPVKLIYSKEEHMGAFVLRLGSRIKAKVGIQKDGTLTALAGTWIVNAGAFSDLIQGQISVGLGEAQLMVRCANWDLKTKLVCTNRNPSGIVRGFGGQELKSALIPILNRAMEKADIEPIGFYKKNFVKTGDGYYWRDGKWRTCGNLDYSGAMEEGARLFGWYERWKGWLNPTAVYGSKRRGIGVGVHGNADSGEDVSEAQVRLNPDGTATLYSCQSEPGTGSRNSLCRMAAEVLRLPLDRISIAPGDTLFNPFEFGLAGSRGTYASGFAVISAAEDATRKLLEAAAPVLGTAPEELDTESGRVFVREKPEKAVSWGRVLGVMNTCTGFARFTSDYTVPNFLMILVEVEVDIDTGKVELLQVIPATNVGKVIDPQSLKGQLHGCLGSAGLDSALFEESVLDRKTGHMLNVNMIDYKWRTFLELPEMKTAILETELPTHRFKAVGVGEITPAPGPSAVLMAVSNAVGVRFSEYPLTPERILQALGKVMGRGPQ